MKRKSLLKKLPVIHLAWALIAAGAWWLGAQHETRVPASRAETRTRFTAADLPAGEGANGMKKKAPLPVRSSSEIESWLQSFRADDGSISAEKMTAALDEALRDPDSVRAMRHFTHLLESLSAENAPAVLAALKSYSGSRDTVPWMALFSNAWGAKDGPAALAGLKAHGDREAALAGWVRTDASGAEQWLADLPRTKKSGWKALQQSLVSGLAGQDPAAALDYVTAQDGKSRRELTGVLTREQMANGVQSTVRWASTLPDPDMRGSALEAVARQYMQEDPRSGAAWAANSSLAPEMRQAVGRVADRMAEQDVLAAYKWTQQLPPSQGQEEAYQQVFSEWARKDPTASSQELLRMPTGHERDNAIHSFAGSLVRENPQDALVWAAAISDPDLRLNTQIDVAKKWNASAPEAAQNWIAANLPPDARQRALGGK